MTRYIPQNRKTSCSDNGLCALTACARAPVPARGRSTPEAQSAIPAARRRALRPARRFIEAELEHRFRGREQRGLFGLGQGVRDGSFQPATARAHVVGERALPARRQRDRDLPPIPSVARAGDPALALQGDDDPRQRLRLKPLLRRQARSQRRTEPIERAENDDRRQGRSALRTLRPQASSERQNGADDQRY